MRTTDLLATTRRILGRLLRRSQRSAWAAAIVPLGSIGTSIAHAAPYPVVSSVYPVTPFSMRITDMERIPGDAEGNAFRISIEVLNWSNENASSLMMAANVGTSTIVGGAPHIVAASVDADGRGGPTGGNDIGTGVSDPVAMHYGYGRSDAMHRSNTWTVNDERPTFVHWSGYNTNIVNSWPTGFSLADRDLLTNFSGPTPLLVAGYGLDALGDTALDGGPRPYTPDNPHGGYPINSADGLVLDIDDWDEGEVFSANWLLAAIGYHSASYHPIDNPLHPIGTADSGNPFGFGVMSLVRVAESIGAAADNLPGPVFAGNVGFDQSVFSFFGNIYEIPNPAEFAAEFGVGITAPFLNAADNVFNIPMNARLAVPEPGALALICCATLTLAGCARRGSDIPD